MKKALEVQCPSTPNFIKLSDGNSMLPISEFTDKELRGIGKMMGEKMVEIATKRRKQKK